MLDSLSLTNKVIGAKQTKKAIETGSAAAVYYAADAEARILTPVLSLCEASGIVIYKVDTMKSLGMACGITIGAAVAAVLKET